MGKEMKILVTGGLGFIGSNISERLVAEGNDITILDNMHTGSEENISSFKSKVRVVKADSVHVNEMKEKFDAIFHDGIYSSTPMYKENPQLTSKVIADWIGVLEYARRNGSRVIYASTSSLYSGQKPPHHEGLPTNVTDFYSEARVAMERLAKLYDQLYSVRSIGLRYFSVYGPHERSKGKYANLISQFLWDLQAGRQPVIYGDGKQTRDFTYVSDVVEANMLALRHGKTDVFNVGTGKSITLNDMLALLNRELGTGISPKYIHNPISNYVEHTLADTSRAASLLGFRASVSLEEGIRRLIRQ